MRHTTRIWYTDHHPRLGKDSGLPPGYGKWNSGDTTRIWYTICGWWGEFPDSGGGGGYVGLVGGLAGSRKGVFLGERGGKDFGGTRIPEGKP